MAESTQTRADRLNAIVANVAPKACAYLAKFGKWPSATSFTADGIVSPAASCAARVARRRVDQPDADERTLALDALRADDAHRSAPYSIQALNGQVKVLVTADDGDQLVGLGDTVDAALAALEAKLS